MNKLISIVVVLCLVGLASAAFAANTLTNPGFEGGGGAGSHMIPPPWNPGFTWQNWGIDGATVHGDLLSFFATTNSGTPLPSPGNMVNGQDYCYVRQMGVPVDQSQPYTLGAWVNKTDAIQIALYYEALDAGNGSLDSGTSAWHTAATNGWQQITYPDVQFPEGTDHITYMVLFMASSPTASGTAYVDDCSVSGLLSASLSGHVYGDEGTSIPVPGASVTLAGGQNAVTNSSGLYNIVNPVLGTGLALTTTAFGYYDGADTVDIAASTEVVKDIHLTAIPAGTLTGHVYGGPGVGTPLSGATVRIIGGSSTTTNESGLYTLAAPGTTGLSAQAFAGSPYSQETVTVDLTPGGTTTQDFHLSVAPAPGLPVFIPMDQQINFDPSADTGQDAITANSISFLPAAPPTDGNGGWARNSLLVGGGADSYYEGPVVDLVKAGFGAVDVSDPNTVMDLYVRVGGGGSAGIDIRLKDSSDRLRTYGYLYDSETDPGPPGWKHLFIYLNDFEHHPWMDWDTDPNFDPTQARYVSVYGTNWGGVGDTYVEAKKITIAIVPPTSVGDIKNLPDDSTVSLILMPVTYSPTMSGVANTTMFYVESVDRSAGIRVDNSLTSVETPLAGTLASFTGSLQTDPATDERFVLLDSLEAGGTDATGPLGVSTRAINEDPKIEGLLIRTSGIVQADMDMDPVDGIQWFKISDGYTSGGAPVATKVKIGSYFGDPSLTGHITEGDTVRLTGVVSRESPTTKVILLRSFEVDTLAALPKPSDPSNSWTCGFEASEGYALGDVGVTNGWDISANAGGTATVVQAPLPVEGSQSLQLYAQHTDPVGTLQDSVTAKHGLTTADLQWMILSFDVCRTGSAVNNDLFWNSLDAYPNGGYEWDGDGGVILPIGDASTAEVPIILGRFHKIVVFMDFTNQKISSWVDEIPNDVDVTFNTSSILKFSDIEFYHWATQPFESGEFGTPAYIDNIRATWEPAAP